MKKQKSIQDMINQSKTQYEFGKEMNPQPNQQNKQNNPSNPSKPYSQYSK